MSILEGVSTVLACRCMATIGFAYSFIMTAFRHLTGEEISNLDSLKEIGIHTLILQRTLRSSSEENYGLNTFTCALSIWFLCRSYGKYVRGRKYQKIDLSGKVYIVTGSNTGIGFQTAKALACMNATVILACRSRDKASAARDQIIQENLDT